MRLYSISSLLSLLAAARLSDSTAFATSSIVGFVQYRPATMIRGGSSPSPVEISFEDTNSTDVETQLPASDSKLGPKAPPPGIIRKMFPKLPWHRLPDILTYLRCFSIPILVMLFYQHGRHVATSILFAFASFTDWLDGYLARRWDIASPFGAFLDPVADKLMVSTSLILLAGRHGAKVAIPTSIILSRELAVSALREWMAQKGKRDSVKVGWQGKVKTAATMLSLTVLLLVPSGKETTTILSSFYNPGLCMLYLCTLLTVSSGSVYFRAAAPVLMGKD